MREILFRGKRTDNGEWAYGLYNELAHRFTGEQEHFIQTVKQDGRIDYIRKVDPETVGQYTGRTDKDGEKIFEGDILKYFDDEIQVVEWDDEWARIMLHTYSERECKQGRKYIKVKHEGWNDLEDYPLEKMPILGNIHDNPELLGGDRNETQ